MLPTGYKLLEYIQSTGSQYIDTEFKPTYQTRTILDMSDLVVGTTKVLFGCRTVGNTGAYGILIASSTTALRSDYFGTQVSLSIGNLTGRSIVDKNRNVCTAFEVTATNTAVASGAADYNLCLFAYNTAGEVNFFSSYKLYSCQIYDNGTPVRKYLPCINPDGEVGLYDLVGAKFYGDAAGVGFTAGPELFPARWIRSTGSQYIKTEFNPNSATTIEITVSDWLNTEVSTALFGTQSSSSDRYDLFVPAAGGTYRSYYYGASVNFAGSVSCADKTTVRRSGSTISIGDTSAVNNETTLSNTTQLFLFAHNNNGKVDKLAAAKMYSCQIYDNGTLVRDYIPMVDADGVGGLYDLVNYTFGRDAAGVGFEAMPELTELEWIESSGTQYIDTGFIPDQDSRIVIDVQTDDYTKNYFIGSRSTTTVKAFAITTNNSMWQAGYNNSSPTTSLAADAERHVCDLNKNVFSVDGEVVYEHTYATFTGYGSIYIGAVLGSSKVYYGASNKFYACQIYDNDTLVRDYIPVLASYGAVGLHDQVNDELYLDAAGGNFIAGPVVVAGLPAPENLIASVTEIGSVDLTWDAVEDALFYTVLQDGLIVANTTETAYSGALVPFANTVFGVVAVNDEFESEPAEVLVQYIPEEYDLITDRTSADVQRVKYLRETGWAVMTEDERTEFLSPLKGAYNACDLNRVEYAARQLAARVNELPVEFRDHAASLGVEWSPLFDVPYNPLSIDTRHDWTVRDVPTACDMGRYLNNVTLLRGLLDYTTAVLPASMDGLTYTGANAIEEALEGLFAAILVLQADRLTLINNTAAAWMYSGEIYGGEV